MIDNIDIEEIRELWRTCAEDATAVNSKFWVRTGNNLDQENAMIAVLLLRVARLEALIKNVVSDASSNV